LKIKNLPEVWRVFCKLLEAPVVAGVGFHEHDLQTGELGDESENGRSVPHGHVVLGQVKGTVVAGLALEHHQITTLGANRLQQRSVLFREFAAPDKTGGQLKRGHSTVQQASQEAKQLLPVGHVLPSGVGVALNSPRRQLQQIRP